MSSEASNVSNGLYTKLAWDSRKVDVVKTVIDEGACRRVSGHVEKSFIYLRVTSPGAGNV
jgi:hypothetical protein